MRVGGGPGTVISGIGGAVSYKLFHSPDVSKKIPTLVALVRIRCRRHRSRWRRSSWGFWGGACAIRPPRSRSVEGIAGLAAPRPR